MSGIVTQLDVEGASCRRYLSILLGAIFAIAISLAGFAVWLAPPSGDLVRIGGTSERSFGWQGTKSSFTKDYYQKITLTELLKGSHTGDILVFGDSFSDEHLGNITWTNTLHEQTGQSVKFLRLRDFSSVVRYLESDVFQETPPAAIIVQSVERATVKRAMGIHEPSLLCEGLNVPITRLETRSGPLKLPRHDFTRRTQFDSLDELFSWGVLAFRKRLEGRSKSIPIQLNRTDLFSSHASGQSLIYLDDIRAHTANAFPQNNPKGARAKALCGLRQLFTRAGTVPMRFMIAPDKRSVYDTWITTPLPTKQIDVFAMARQALGAGFIDLLAPLTKAAETNKDVYFPNDTHWGPIGHKIAGMNAAASFR